MADAASSRDDRARLAAPDRLACATPDVVPMLMLIAILVVSLLAGLVALVVMYA